jgi:hypothetical protein
LAPDCSNEPAGSASREERVCYRWRCEGRDIAAAQWSGDTSTCNAGNLDEDAAVRALRIINVHRFIAGADPVRNIASWSRPAQACALLAHANHKLSHQPPRDWSCWSDVGAFTSSVSLIANRSLATAIGAFIEDTGNEATMVHRRWLLSENLERVGFGSTDRYACVVVEGSSFGDTRSDSTDSNDENADSKEEHASASSSPNDAWVAWPPDGPVPMEMLDAERVDDAGWTVQSPTEDLDASTVEVTVTIDGATTKNVHVSHLTPRFGSRSAIRFTPDGWLTAAGHRYAVTVTMADGKKIEYVVAPTDC